jgi:hypothetical protein
MNLKGTGPALIFFAAACHSALADDIPGDCLASFNVRPENVVVNISWNLPTGASAVMSCGAAELLREQLFVEGSSMLTENDLSGASPTGTQSQAITAFRDMQNQIQQLPGDDVPGTLFAAGGYSVAKYLLASCILTVEEAGGTCWAAAGSFLAATSRFFVRIFQNQSNTLRKQELLTDLANLQPTITGLQAGQADPNGARSRWVATQTQLCRAIQQQCLQ